MQIIPCAVRSAHLWLKSAKVELTSDSFAQPKQHVQSLVFPHLQRQMSRNLLEDKDGTKKRSTTVAQQIWKDLLLEKNCWRTKREERFGFNPEVIYVDARKKDGSSYSLGSLKTLRFALNWHFKAVQSFGIINYAEFSEPTRFSSPNEHLNGFEWFEQFNGFEWCDRLVSLPLYCISHSSFCIFSIKQCIIKR